MKIKDHFFNRNRDWKPDFDSIILRWQHFRDKDLPRLINSNTRPALAMLLCTCIAFSAAFPYVPAVQTAAEAPHNAPSSVGMPGETKLFTAETSGEENGESTEAAEPETEFVPAPYKLNLAYQYPEGSDESWAEILMKELIRKDSQWYAQIYDMANVAPASLASQLGRSAASVLGRYNPTSAAQNSSDPSTWAVEHFSNVRVSFYNGSGSITSAVSNAQDIMAMASVYAYQNGIEDIDELRSYMNQLWSASHSYSVSMGDVYYDSGCISAEGSSETDYEDSELEGEDTFRSGRSINTEITVKVPENGENSTEFPDGTVPGESDGTPAFSLEGSTEAGDGFETVFPQETPAPGSALIIPADSRTDAENTVSRPGAESTTAVRVLRPDVITDAETQTEQETSAVIIRPVDESTEQRTEPQTESRSIPQTDSQSGPLADNQSTPQADNQSAPQAGDQNVQPTENQTAPRTEAAPTEEETTRRAVIRPVETETEKPRTSVERATDAQREVQNEVLDTPAVSPAPGNGAGEAAAEMSAAGEEISSARNNGALTAALNGGFDLGIRIAAAAVTLDEDAAPSQEGTFSTPENAAGRERTAVIIPAGETTAAAAKPEPGTKPAPQPAETAATAEATAAAVTQTAPETPAAETGATQAAETAAAEPATEPAASSEATAVQPSTETAQTVPEASAAAPQTAETEAESTGAAVTEGTPQEGQTAAAAGENTELVCPGHIDLHITAKIYSVNDGDSLYKLDAKGSKAGDQNGWPGWDELMRSYVEHINRDDWVETYGLNVTIPSTSAPLSETEIDSYLDLLPSDLPAERREIIRFALQSVGKIPYYWGGKPSTKNYTGNNFGSITIPDHRGRILRGLDCSGWINWVYWSVTGRRLPYEGTDGLRTLGRQIARKDLQPGDIIVITGSTPHVIMFLSWTSNGQIQCIHESGSANNVNVGIMTANWPYYRNLID